MVREACTLQANKPTTSCCKWAASDGGKGTDHRRPVTVTGRSVMWVPAVDESDAWLTPPGGRTVSVECSPHRLLVSLFLSSIFRSIYLPGSQVNVFSPGRLIAEWAQKAGEPGSRVNEPGERAGRLALQV